MTDALALFVLVLFAFGAFLLGWRILARRTELPCPSSLIWLLENRFVDRVAGAQKLIARAGIQPGMSVLDAGCGPGRLTLPMAARVGPEGNVLAVDLQPSMLARLQDRLTTSGLTNVQVLLAGLGNGALPEGRFDRAVMVTVLGEIPDRLAALREVHRALKPGGALSVTEILPDPHYQRQKTVRTLGEKAGFTVGEVFATRRSFTMNLVKPAV